MTSHVMCQWDCVYLVVMQYDVVSRPLLDARSAYLVESALADLASYLDDPSQRETKNRQKLLRNLRVCDGLVNV